MNEEVLDHLFGTCLPKFAELVARGALIPDDFIGVTDEKPNYNTEEVCDWKYLNQHDLEKLLNKTPESFSPWFNLCYKRVFDKVNQLNIT